MAPILEAGEQIILTFDAGYNPAWITASLKKAHLTNKRLIFETKPETSIPFSSIVEVTLANWQVSGKIIELDYGQKIRFNIIRWGGSYNDNTIVLSGWLKDLKGQHEMSPELMEKIRGGLKDFNKYKAFGTKFDLSKPHAWIAAFILMLGVVFGGALGAGISFLVVVFILRIGERSDYSPAKKWAYILSSIIAGAVVFLVLASILFVAINTILGEKITPEEKQMLDAAVSLNKSRTAFLATLSTKNYSLILAAEKEYNHSVDESIAVSTSGCRNNEVRERNPGFCSQVELLNRCNKRDAETCYWMSKLAYAPKTMSKDECSMMIESLKKQSECVILDKSYLISNSTLAQFEKACEAL